MGGWMSGRRGPMTGCRCSEMEHGLSQKDGGLKTGKRDCRLLLAESWVILDKEAAVFIVKSK